MSAPTVIIPAGCDGPRFNNGMPMWLRRLPTGRGLILDQIVGEDLDLTNVGCVALVVLVRHIESYFNGNQNGIARLLEKAVAKNPTGGNVQCQIVALDKEESSGPDTVAAAIRLGNISGPIFIKDNDGSFKHKVGTSGNYVVGLSLGSGKSNGSGIMEATTSIDTLLTKSFIQRTGSLLTNIVEKKLVSNMIAVGGFFFESANDFISAVEALQETEGRLRVTLPQPTAFTRKFISHVIQRMLLSHTAFAVTTTDAFDDWKTEQTWDAYSKSFSTVVRSIELDILNLAYTSTPDQLEATCSEEESWLIEGDSNQTVQHLRTLRHTYGNRCTIILTTSSINEAAVKVFLGRFDIPCSRLLLGIAHGRTM